MKRRLRFNLKKKLKRKLYLGVNKTAKKKMLEMDRFQDYQKIKVPKIFSLTKEPNAAIKFMANVERALSLQRKVFIDMSDVELLSDGALVVLLSSMIKFKSRKIDFNGNFPVNEDSNIALIESGFFDQLYKSRTLKAQDSYSFDFSNKKKGGTILTHANKIVDSKLSATIIREISKLIWGENRRCTGLQRTYLELMQNTNNHAANNNKGVHHWWTTVSYDQYERKAYFSFIDYGIGIINSLQNDESNKFFVFLKKIYEKFNPKNEAELLKLLLDGQIHSSTGQYYRGKGLPGICSACRDNKISNLVVITNKAMANVSKGQYVSLDSNFPGTFVYWELSQENRNII